MNDFRIYRLIAEDATPLEVGVDHSTFSVQNFVKTNSLLDSLTHSVRQIALDIPKNTVTKMQRCSLAPRN